MNKQDIIALSKRDIKELLEENFNFLSSMTVKEYTLYRKWVDLRKKYPIAIKEEDPFDDFFDVDSNSDYPELDMVKNNIWVPESPEDYTKIQPKIVFATANENTKTWQILRDFCHSAVWHQSPGRLFKFYVEDELTGKYLGILSMGSDFISVGGRDAIIKWSREARLEGKLKNTLMGSTIAAVQPFGYNYNGGKLMALLAASSVIADKWLEKYGDVLAGVTTTSLYGGASMYNRLKYWKKCKSTEGKIMIEPSEDVYDIARIWLSKNYPEHIPQNPPGKKILSHPKFKYLTAIYKLCGAKPPENNAPRGVYWNELYENTNAFLRGDDAELGNKKYDNRPEVLCDMWKERYAKKRVANLIKNDRLTNEVLFYDDILSMEWEEVKEKYLNEC